MIQPTTIPCTSATFAELSAEILGAGLDLRFRARGTSMSPLVRDGDVLLVRPTHVRPLRVGDLALCRTEPGRAVVHRVIRRGVGDQGLWFTLQGDARPRSDGDIPQAQVYGRVVSIERAGVDIDLDRPVMRLLSRLAVLRSRWNIGRGGRFSLARRLGRKLPVLDRYLA